MFGFELVLSILAFIAVVSMDENFLANKSLSFSCSVISEDAIGLLLTVVDI